MEVLPRITIEPDKMGGKACIRGHRFTVEHLLGLLAEGMKQEEIIREWDFLEPEDFAAALRYASYLAGEKNLPLAS
jgi:uncharacterized protein (DUF433 family)